MASQQKFTAQLIRHNTAEQSPFILKRRKPQKLSESDESDDSLVEETQPETPQAGPNLDYEVAEIEDVEPETFIATTNRKLTVQILHHNTAADSSPLFVQRRKVEKLSSISSADMSESPDEDPEVDLNVETIGQKKTPQAGGSSVNDEIAQLEDEELEESSPPTKKPRKPPCRRGHRRREAYFGKPVIPFEERLENFINEHGNGRPSMSQGRDGVLSEFAVQCEGASKGCNKTTRRIHARLCFARKKL